MIKLSNHQLLINVVVKTAIAVCAQSYTVVSPSSNQWWAFSYWDTIKVEVHISRIME